MSRGRQLLLRADEQEPMVRPCLHPCGDGLARDAGGLRDQELHQDLRVEGQDTCRVDMPPGAIRQEVVACLDRIPNGAVCF
jgi:hypothetical protein